LGGFSHWYIPSLLLEENFLHFLGKLLPGISVDGYEGVGNPPKPVMV
jgi:hypothetical protein